MRRERSTPVVRRAASTLLLATCAVLAGCPMDSPTEVRDNGQQFPVSATWTATAEPIEPATVAGTFTAEQHLGFRVNATFSLTGNASTTYQWRIFRGPCSMNYPATTAAPDGLLLFSTVQAYPDVALGPSGTASVEPAIAGALDEQSSYSVRVRAAATSTNWDGTNPIACGDMQRSSGS